MGALYSKVVWGADLPEIVEGEMPELTVQVTLAEGATLPNYTTTGAAGMDLHALERTELYPHVPTLVDTGVSVALPFMLYGQIAGRSGLAAKHAIRVHSGVIDCDFRGRIKVLVIHEPPPTVSYLDPTGMPQPSYVIGKNDRVAQLLILPVARPGLEVVPTLDATARGEGGFGSTDAPGPELPVS